MGFCVKCKEFVAPDFMVKSDLCAFCHKNVNVIINDEGIIFTKQAVVEDYKELLNKLKETRNLKDIQFKSIVNKELKR